MAIYTAVTASLRRLGGAAFDRGCAMCVVSAGYIFTAYMLIAQSVCQALGNELYCLVVMLLRVVVVLLPLPRHCSRQSSSARGRQLPLRVRCSAVPF
ncbi:hypothetical protein [Cloacibacillus porcorum]|uniref:hypothetical protein n=1 Tax=Cloacibacillus porcorum TaxID=1197717 RepID=UPI0014596398|nr:hypothetical protein [Cloacibacillus porcorum]MCC8183799.1 hypothetical protein [Cloacibacillus porcorum]MDY5388888.1 hypothetical protein [Cloacibacillus porcorum]NMF18438.1 hypothetical protein [Cloacibacillus porcorum]